MNFNLQRWEGSVWSKVLTVILVLAILGALGMLVYIVAVPHVGETFTEFYLLGYEGKAENYPAQFILDKNRVVNVVYGQSGLKTADDHGQIILGIVNREQKDVSYSVELTIDEQPLNINLDGKNSNRIMSRNGNKGSDLLRCVQERTRKWCSLFIRTEYWLKTIHCTSG